MTPFPGWTPQYSLRQLVGLTTIASLWLSAMRTVPHWAIVMLSLALATFVTRLHRNLRMRMRGFTLSFDDRLALSSLATMSAMAWLFLYIASVGPAAAISTHLSHIPVCGHVLGTFYAPIVWVHDHTPLRNALDVYIHHWNAGQT